MTLSDGDATDWTPVDCGGLTRFLPLPGYNLGLG